MLMAESYQSGNMQSIEKVTRLGAFNSYQNSDNGRMANRLREVRKSLGLSGEKLAEIAGTTKATISRLEKGERGLTVVWIDKLVAALHAAGYKSVRPSDFLEGPSPLIIPELMDKLSVLREDQQRSFAALIESMSKEDKK